MTYQRESIEGKLLDGDAGALRQVEAWIGTVLRDRRFRTLQGEADDLRQEVCLQLLASLRAGRFDPSREFRKYVQGIARFTSFRAMSTWRARGVVEAGASAGAPAPRAGVEGPLVDHLLARDLLAAASGDCRRLFLLQYYHRLGHDEIAARLALPVGTVKSRLSRCLEAAHRCGARRGSNAVRRPSAARPGGMSTCHALPCRGSANRFRSRCSGRGSGG